MVFREGVGMIKWKRFRNLNKKQFRKEFLRQFNIRTKDAAEMPFFVQWTEICWKGYLRNGKMFNNDPLMEKQS